MEGRAEILKNTFARHEINNISRIIRARTRAIVIRAIKTCLVQWHNVQLNVCRIFQIVDTFFLFFVFFNCLTDKCTRSSIFKGYRFRH
jgi:hypothetical protein